MKLPGHGRQVQRVRRGHARNVKTHRSYTVDEAASVANVAKGSVLRWVKLGLLPALVDRRPYLILGADLSDFLKAKRSRGTKLALAELYCFKCRGPRKAALGLAEYIPMSPASGNLRALCECCTTLMHKAFSLSRLGDLGKVLIVTIREDNQHLDDAARASPNDHFNKES